ncbi:PRC-barrel domain-containing protein [Streptomyces mirabilis]|uniref:PRC-barrel domain-containing protein n=1 Tax=Streptomyces mirabilis TaxID=68239 RepID=UPI002E36B335|nr:PRC-barrel domain-containing protein [Streptomyces mirabilis]
MTLFSEIRGLPVVTLGEANELGIVRSLTIDVVSGLVGQVRLSPARGRKEIAIDWSALHVIGPDAVLVRSGTALDTAPPPAPVEILGVRVLTEDGDERGTVRDIAFDPVTGRVETMCTALGDIPGDRLVGLGDYALVVRTG